MRTPTSGSSGQAQLDRLEAALTELGASGEIVRELVDAGLAPTGSGDLPVRVVGIAGRLLAAAAHQPPERMEMAGRAVDATADALGISAPAFSAAVAEVAFLESGALLLPPLLTARHQLDLLCVLGGLRGASLWRRGEEGSIVALCRVGSGSDSERARLAVVAALGGDSPSDTSALAVVPVLRHGERVGAISIRRGSDTHPAALRLASACARAIAVALDRSVMLDRRAAAERMLVEAGEHRLRRVGLDLHDGPLQSAAQLAGELRLLHAQASELGLGERDLARLRGRLDDLLSRLTRLDEELRELAAGFESPIVLNASFETALAEEVEAFERRSGKRAAFALTGSLDALSPSQRIALFRMLQEALSNVRQHSAASQVAVTVVAEPAGVRAEIVDDGVGFDPGKVLVSAKGRRHLGLAGVRERALLLGGTAEVESRPGGPTRLRIFLPASPSLPGLVDDLVWAIGSRRESSEPQHPS